MSTEERGPNPGHDHDEGRLMEQREEQSEKPQFNDGDSPETTDGQIRPAGVAPGDGMDNAYSDTDGTGGGDHIDADAGGRAHTPVEDGHPGLDGSRSARDLGGPKLAPEDLADAEDTTGAAKGDIKTKGQEPHQ